jgi:hypothetical protein
LIADSQDQRPPAPDARSTTTAQVQDAFKTFYRADGQTIKRITYGRQVMNAEIETPVPDHLVGGINAFKIHLPHARTVPIHTLNLVTQKWPTYHRYATGIEIRPQEISTRIEQAANTGVQKLFSYREAGDLMLNESQVYVVVAPDRAHYETAPDYFDPSSMLDERRYSRLTPSEKKLYVEDTASKQSRRFGLPSKEFQRDEKGRPPTHAYYTGSDRQFTRDREQTAKTYTKALERHRSQRLPITIKTYSRLDVAPIGVRFEGNRVCLDGMVTRETFTRSHLMRKGYVWDSQADALVPDLNGDVTLYGWWYYDPKGCPTVAYSVDGSPTYKRKQTADGEQLADAVIDLRETCGLTRLPIAAGFGWHTAERDIDKRGWPFPWVFGSNWLAADAIASGMTYQQWAQGYGGKAFTPDTQQGMDDFLADLERSMPGLPRNVLFTPPGAITVLPPGKFFDLSSTTPNLAGQAMLQFLLQANQEESTPSGAIGGGGDMSGWARNVMSAQLQQGLSQVRDGELNLYADIGSLFLEGMTRHAEIYGTVKMAVPTPVPVASTEKSPTRTVIEFTDQLCGEMFDIDAEFEVTFGENLAQNAQAIEMAKARVIPYRKALELIGDPSPEATEAEILAEDERRSPQGLARVRALAARIVGDEEEAARLQAQADGLVDENGEPTGVQQGLQGAGGAPQPQPAQPGPGGGATGVSSPDPGQAQLASIVGAQHQTGPQNRAAVLGSMSGTQMPVSSTNGAGGLG